MKLMVISAISREDSTTYLLAKVIAEICAEHATEVDFVTPADTGLPVNDGTIPWDLPEAKAWQERIEAIHAYVWVSPEYHSGMAASLKNLFDYLAKEPMRGDVVGLAALAGGAMAALNTLNNMSVVARSLGAWVAPDYVAMNSNEVKEGLSDGSRQRLESMCVGVIDAARRLGSADADAEVDLPME
ncbi:MAG TPA: NAD(P)H-dependent oxidoreductase [Acidimicrobiia bacterium]|nr:NAD(P)H-dependent oxidoreductase [Acidimicrobiia bacterium]